MTITRLYALPNRRLTNEEKKWLENRTHDKRPAVKGLACEIYHQRFRHAERNALKKQLQINYAEFVIHWHGYCDELPVNRKYTMDRGNALLCMQDLDEPDDPNTLQLQESDMAWLLKWMVHELEVFCWEEDFCGEAAAQDDEEYPGTELPTEKSEPDMRQESSWSLRLIYADGTQQSTESRDTALPDQIVELHYELNQRFCDEEDDFEFFELADGCHDLMELSSLISSLLAQAEEYQDYGILGEVMLDITMLSNESLCPPLPDQPPYHICSDTQAILSFMQSIMTQAMTGEEDLVVTGKERLVRFTEIVRETITSPRGALISVAEIETILKAIESKYGLLRWLSESGTMRILRLPNSHRQFNSICNAVRPRDAAERFHYELYLFHVNGEAVGHPAYILLHEIGHALQIYLTRKVEEIPQSFRNILKQLLGTHAPQDATALELYADAFAMAMMQTFGWNEYDPFNEIPLEVKTLFQKYFDLQLQKIAADKNL